MARGTYGLYLAVGLKRRGLIFSSPKKIVTIKAENTPQSSVVCRQHSGISDD